jgi:hypothetical protein
MITKNQLIMTMQCVVAVLLGLEVSIPPNPYKMPLILSMVVLICLKHDIPNKIMEKLMEWLFRWKGDNHER